MAAPALALLIVLTVAGVSLSRSIQAVIFLEGASSGSGALRQAAGRGWLAAVARTVVLGLIVGLLVLALQVFLQPGHASLAA